MTSVKNMVGEMYTIDAKIQKIRGLGPPILK